MGVYIPQIILPNLVDNLLWLFFFFSFANLPPRTWRRSSRKKNEDEKREKKVPINLNAFLLKLPHIYTIDF